MYSSKLVHKSMVANNAYITVGDPYHDPKANPFRQGKKGEKLTPFQSKGIPQNAELGYFTKKSYVPEGYKEGIKYITTQPLDQRKLGFGTKDAHKRDEFSSNNRTEQYRETLRKEKEMAESPEVVKEKLTKLLAERATMDFATQTRYTNTLSGGPKRIRQYDIGRTQVTDFNPKATRDKFYRFDEEHGRYFGDLAQPISCEVGAAAWETQYRPPAFGGKGEVKNFFDKSHLQTQSF
ncbi:hypothetical protein EON64_05480 [archaeon]|nr:MAG: hypothetical protein EON64_05480 [archaeon]